MALATVAGGVEWPGSPCADLKTTGWAGTEQTHIVNAVNEKYFVVLAFNVDTQISGFAFPDNGNYILGTTVGQIETVDSSGLPSGTLYHASATATYVSTGVTYFPATITVSAGVLVAIGFRCTAYTSSDFTTTYAVTDWFRESQQGFPYVVTNTALVASPPMIQLWGPSGEYIHVPGVVFPDTGFTTNMSRYGNADTYPYRGSRVRFPFYGTMKGISTWGDHDSPMEILVHSIDASGTATLVTTITPTDANKASSTPGHFTYYFDAPLTILPEETYDFLIGATSAATIGATPEAAIFMIDEYTPGGAGLRLKSVIKTTGSTRFTTEGMNSFITFIWDTQDDGTGGLFTAGSSIMG